MNDWDFQLPVWSLPLHYYIKKTTLCHRLDYFWSRKSAKVCTENLLVIISELSACQGSLLHPYLRPLKPAGHWQFPVMWSHTPPLRQEQSLLQLIPYLPRGHGWVQTEPFEKQPAINNVSQINVQQSQFSKSYLHLPLFIDICVIFYDYLQHVWLLGERSEKHFAFRPLTSRL